MKSHRIIFGRNSPAGLLFFAVLVSTLLAFAGPVAAATFTVTNVNDSGAGSLRDAIAAAGSGDTINFAVTGTITLTSGDLLVDKNLNINGPGPGSLTVQRSSATGTPYFRIFTIPDVGSPFTVSISGLTITKGYSSGYGGGIYKGGNTLTLTNCSLSHNSCYSTGPGGGIYSSGRNLTLIGCSLSSNSATEDDDAAGAVE